ncbi:MAG TPA: hypothetical protein VHT97_11670 [Acidimicrobiales bacterium]|nr:hypothetical protein [Acidimicrobiales bacterium]
MHRSGRRWLFGLLATTAVLVPTALAWACVGLMSLTTSSPNVQPGGSVTVLGKEFAQGAPVEIHLDSPTGQLLTTVPAPTDTMTSQFKVNVTIPANVPAGQHVLVATQAYHYMNGGAPARATVFVGTPAPAPAGPAVRPGNVVFDKAPSGLSLFLIGLAVAAVGLVLAAALNLAASRRQPRAPAAEAS